MSRAKLWRDGGEVAGLRLGPEVIDQRDVTTTPVIIPEPLPPFKSGAAGMRDELVRRRELLIAHVRDLTDEVDTLNMLIEQLDKKINEKAAKKDRSHKIDGATGSCSD